METVAAGRRYVGPEIVLRDDERPTAVLVTVGGATATGPAEKQRWWHGVRMPDVSQRIESVVRDEQVIALKPGFSDTFPEEVPLFSEYAANKDAPKKLDMKTYRCVPILHLGVDAFVGVHVGGCAHMRRCIMCVRLFALR